MKPIETQPLEIIFIHVKGFTYTMYLMYTMYMWTLAEFRKNTRKAFNDADSGHEVVIERYGQRYQLVSLVELPLGGNSFESTPTEVKPIKELLPKLKVAPERLANGLCKLHGTPLDVRGRCLMKGCKYS